MHTDNRRDYNISYKKENIDIILHRITVKVKNENQLFYLEGEKKFALELMFHKYQCYKN